MSIISSDLVSSNLNFAIRNITTTLTVVSPTSNSETYIANKQDVGEGFVVFDDGQEDTIDTRFYINVADYATLPSKGTILIDGAGRTYKVKDVENDAIGVTLKINASARYQR